VLPGSATFAQCRQPARIAESCFINALDQIVGLLEFDRQIESGRDVNPPQLNASLIAAARGNLIRPEVEAALIRLAIQKIEIMHAHKETWGIDRIWAGGHVIVSDRDGRYRWRSQRSANRIAEISRESLWPFQVRVIDDECRDGLGRFARRESHSRQTRFVIAARRSHAGRDIAVLRAGEIAGGKAETRRKAGVTNAGDGCVDALIAFLDWV